MDNNDKELMDLLKSSIPNRFMNLDPFDFESFIARLFRARGYEVHETPKSGDYGADIIAEKEGEKIAVQVKLFNKNNLVGVQSINQAIGSKSYYKCDKTQVITTSSFSKQGLNLGERADVILWDWDVLYNAISDTFLNGKDIYSFLDSESQDFNDENEKVQSERLSFSFDKMMVGVMAETKEEAPIIYFRIKNNTKDIINVELTKSVILIDNLNNQFSAHSYLTGSFMVGDIYPQCSVVSSWWWGLEQAPRSDIIKKIVMYYTEDGKNERRAIITEIPKEIRFEKINNTGVECPKCGSNITHNTTDKEKCWICGSNLIKRVESDEIHDQFDEPEDDLDLELKLLEEEPLEKTDPISQELNKITPKNIGMPSYVWWLLLLFFILLMAGGN